MKTTRKVRAHTIYKHDGKKVPGVQTRSQVGQCHLRLVLVTTHVTQDVGHAQVGIQGKDLILGQVGHSLRIGGRDAEADCRIARARCWRDGSIGHGGRLATDAGAGQRNAGVDRRPR